MRFLLAYFFLGYSVHPSPVVVEDLSKLLFHEIIHAAKKVYTTEGIFYNFSFCDQNFNAKSTYDVLSTNINSLLEEKKESPIGQDTISYIRDCQKFVEQKEPRRLIKIKEGTFLSSIKFFKEKTLPIWQPGLLVLNKQEFLELKDAFRRDKCIMEVTEINTTYFKQSIIIINNDQSKYWLLNTENYIWRKNLPYSMKDYFNFYYSYVEDIIVLKKKYFSPEQGQREKYTVLEKKKYEKIMDLIEKIIEQPASSFIEYCIKNCIKKVEYKTYYDGNEDKECEVYAIFSSQDLCGDYNTIYIKDTNPIEYKISKDEKEEIKENKKRIQNATMTLDEIFFEPEQDNVVEPGQDNIFDLKIQPWCNSEEEALEKFKKNKQLKEFVTIETPGPNSASADNNSSLIQKKINSENDNNEESAESQSSMSYRYSQEYDVENHIPSQEEKGDKTILKTDEKQNKWTSVTIILIFIVVLVLFLVYYYQGNKTDVFPEKKLMDK